MSEGKAQAYLQAMLVGDTSGFTKQDKRLFQYWGISHLLVVSGLHVGAFFLLIRGLISVALWSAFFIPGRYVLARYLPDLLGVWCAWWYVLLLELPVSATRAVIAVTLYVLLQLFGWKSRGFTKVLLAFLSVISLWPGVWEEVGFQLTFSALFALVFAGYLRKRFQLSWWQNSLLVTLCPTLSTSLVLYLTIGGASWLSFIGTIVFAPFFIFIGFYGGVLTLLLSLCSSGFGYWSGNVIGTLLLCLHKVLLVVASFLQEEGAIFVVLSNVLSIGLPAAFGLTLLHPMIRRPRMSRG
jgi:competence protein ComEC